MRYSLKRLVSLFLVILLLIPAMAIAEDTTDADDTTEDESFYLLDYFEGTALDLTQYEGKAILLNFFTSWCVYCMEEMDDIKLVYDTYDPDSLVIILIHPWNGEDATESAEVVAEYGLEDITLIEDEDLTISDLVGLQGYPTSIFVDMDGNYYGYAYSMDFDSFSEVFDSLGVPTREDVEADTDTSETEDTDEADDSDDTDETDNTDATDESASE